MLWDQMSHWKSQQAQKPLTLMLMLQSLLLIPMLRHLKLEENQYLGRGGRVLHDWVTEAVFSFANDVKESTHSERAPGIVKAVMSCTNYPKPALMFCLDHLMEHKRSALGFLDMDEEQKDLWSASYLAKNNYFV